MKEELTEFVQKKGISPTKAIELLEPHKKDADSLSESSSLSIIDECPLSDEVPPCPSTSTDESIKASATEDTDMCPLSAKVPEACIQNLEVCKENEEKTDEDVLVEFINDKGISPNDAIEMLQQSEKDDDSLKAPPDEPIMGKYPLPAKVVLPLVCSQDNFIPISNGILPNLPTRQNPTTDTQPPDENSVTVKEGAYITLFHEIQQPKNKHEEMSYSIMPTSPAELCTATQASRRDDSSHDTINKGASLGMPNESLVAPNTSQSPTFSNTGQPFVPNKEKKSNTSVSGASNTTILATSSCHNPVPISNTASSTPSPKTSNTTPASSTEAEWETKPIDGWPPDISSSFVLPPINWVAPRLIRNKGDEIVVPAKTPAPGTEAEWEMKPIDGRTPASSSCFVLPPITWVAPRLIQNKGDEIVVPAKTPAPGTEAEWEMKPIDGRPPDSSSCFVLPPITWVAPRLIQNKGDEIVVPAKTPAPGTEAEWEMKPIDGRPLDSSSFFVLLPINWVAPRLIQNKGNEIEASLMKALCVH